MTWIPPASAIAIGVFRENKGRSWSHAATVAALRYLSSLNLDTPTVRTFIGAGTAQEYQKWALGQEYGILTDSLPDGAKLHWIGPRLDTNKDRVLLYFHGEFVLSVYMLHNSLIKINS
jgi:hypothetical protein